MSRSYAIIGTGALGGFYGARLQHAGIETHFLLHNDYDHVRQHGIICESKDGDFTLPKVHAYQNAREMPPCDVVCVALKSTDNHILPQILPFVLKDNGVALVMQNGLGIEDQIASIVGPHRVAGGLCFLCSNKPGPGHICHLDYGYIRLAELHGPPTDRLRAIAADFNHAGVDAQCLDDLATARWQKLVWNIPYNGLSVILRATTDRLMASPHTRALVAVIMREVVANAAACGSNIPNSFIQKMLDDTERMKPYKTSMMLDYEAGRPMEIEAIFGNPLRAAQRVGAPSPLLETLYRELKFLDPSANNRFTRDSVVASQ
jgi:2-dehydropantoate 2-reductase